jgi:hypothetical protein
MPVYRTPKRGISYSEALAAAYASAPEAEILLDTLEFRHASFVTAGLPYAVRVVNDHSELLAFLEDDAPLNAGEQVSFMPTRFTLTRPSETDSGSTPELEIVVDNAARLLVPYLDAVKESRDPVMITWRPYLASDLTGPHMLPVLTLSLTSVSMNMSQVVARAGFGNMVNRRFPALEYLSLTHPGLTAR